MVESRVYLSTCHLAPKFTCNTYVYERKAICSMPKSSKTIFNLFCLWRATKTIFIWLINTSADRDRKIEKITATSFMSCFFLDTRMHSNIRVLGHPWVSDLSKVNGLFLLQNAEWAKKRRDDLVGAWLSKYRVQYFFLNLNKLLASLFNCRLKVLLRGTGAGETELEVLLISF